VGPEKTVYDFWVPAGLGICLWGAYMLIGPKPPIFGDSGLLKFVRDLLVMGVPFMVGALVAVAMGAPGPHLDRRPVGTELFLDGESLTMRRFVCYMLGYLSFLGIITLAAAYGAEVLHAPVLHWTENAIYLRAWVRGIGMFFLVYLLSFLAVTVLWSISFFDRCGKSYGSVSGHFINTIAYVGDDHPQRMWTSSTRDCMMLVN
jgi:hypothetical protein